MLVCFFLLLFTKESYAYIDWSWNAGKLYVDANNRATYSRYISDVCGYARKGNAGTLTFFKSLNDFLNSTVAERTTGLRGNYISYVWDSSITQHSNSGGNAYWTVYFNNFTVPTNATVAAFGDQCNRWWHVNGGYLNIVRLVNTNFNANGGYFSNGTTVITQSGYPDHNVSVSAPSRSRYIFLGWSTSPSATSPSTLNYSSGATYYAVWKQDTVNISFNPNGGSGSTSTVALKPGSSYTPTTPTRTGYNFSGWYTAASGGSKWNNVVPTSAATYYAHWNPITYQITYSDIGENYTGPTSYTIESAEISLPKPAKTDYEFLGFTGSNGSTPAYPVSIPKGSTGDKTYTANWKALPPIINEQPKGMTAIEYTGLTEAQYLKQHNDGNRLVYPYGEIELSVKATGGSSNGTTNVYQWEYTTNGTDWMQVKGSTNNYIVNKNTSILSLSNVRRELNGAKFRCKISNKSDKSTISKEAKVVVYYLPTIE